MDTKKLRTFWLVAKYGNLLSAANRLKLSLPAVSIQLKKLERELGVPLFHHLPNKLILTDQGQVFLREVNKVFEALERAKAVVSDKADGYSGRISISLGSDIAKFFAPRIASFIRNHPRLGITLLARPSPETLSLVAGGEIDLGVGRFESVPRGIHKKKLLENGVSLVFPRNHPLSRKEKLGLADLAAYRLIMLTRSSETRRIIDSVFLRKRIEVENILEVGSCQSALDFVRLGLGVGLVHDMCVFAEPQKKILSRNVSEFFGVTAVFLIYRPAISLHPAYRALIDYLHSSSRHKVSDRLVYPGKVAGLGQHISRR
ncbi:MAG: LysR family transcriptional regulator [Deltaproteobacteria bacterium]|nr:LysR family transcriptional regulator [Deltaproteobacteria bacterium]